MVSPFQFAPVSCKSFIEPYEAAAAHAERLIQDYLKTAKIRALYSNRPKGSKSKTHKKRKADIASADDVR